MRIIIRITRCNTLSPLTLFTPRPMMRRTGYVRLAPEAASRMHTAASLAHRSEAASQVHTLTSLSQRSHSMANASSRQWLRPKCTRLPQFRRNPAGKCHPRLTLSQAENLRRVLPRFRLSLLLLLRWRLLWLWLGSFGCGE